MHIHRSHFLAFLENGRTLQKQEWLDIINLPVDDSVDVIMDLTDPSFAACQVSAATSSTHGLFQ